MLNKQWHYKNTGDENLVTPIRGVRHQSGAGVEIMYGRSFDHRAVSDAAVIYTHPDLKANMWVNEKELNGEEGADDDGNGYADDIYGFNFISEYSAITGKEEYIGEIQWNPDSNGQAHGTHVAGTIAAVNNNGIGVCGIAGGSGNGGRRSDYVGSVFRGQRAVLPQMVRLRGIQYAADNGASVLQCSWGEPNGRPATEEEYLKKFGVQADAFNYFINKPRPGEPAQRRYCDRFRG